jgi:hypothetical protein
LTLAFASGKRGEGSFIVSKRGDLSLVLTQSLYNKNILYDIKNKLGFGKIVLQSKRLKSVRWVVQDAHSLKCGITLFNGNMVLPTRLERFHRFVEGYNAFIRKPRLRKRDYGHAIQPLKARVNPTLNDGWIAGFSDGEACFFARMTTSSYKFSYSI